MLKSISSVILATLALIGVGAVIWFFIRESGTNLQDILFWVGAAPIAFFSIGLLGNFLGRGDSSYQLSRSVSDQSANQRGVQDERDKDSGISFGLIWLVAGLLVWLISYFL